MGTPPGYDARDGATVLRKDDREASSAHEIACKRHERRPLTGIAHSGWLPDPHIGSVDAAARELEPGGNGMFWGQRTREGIAAGGACRAAAIEC